MQDYIYVLVSRTGTNIAKIIRFFTRKPYNHASISADSNLHEMYSFCRNSPSAPARHLQPGDRRTGHLGQILGHSL